MACNGTKCRVEGTQAGACPVGLETVEDDLLDEHRMQTRASGVSSPSPSHAPGSLRSLLALDSLVVDPFLVKRPPPWKLESDDITNIDAKTTESLQNDSYQPKVEKDETRLVSRENNHLSTTLVNQQGRRVGARLYRVVRAHTGWVRAAAVDPTNSVFYTGSTDGHVIAFDLAKGSRRLTLTGHTNGVTCLTPSVQSPYLFSGGDDRQVLCWDLVTNAKVRTYHGHLSGVLSVCAHSGVDIIASGSRDSSARIWDVRTQQETHRLTSFRGPVQCVAFDEANGLLLASSSDKTIQAYDIRAGKISTVLTHHSKAVRNIACFSDRNAFVSVGADGIRIWKLPECVLMKEVLFSTERIIHGMSVSCDSLVALAGDDGILDIIDGTTLTRAAFVDTTSGKKMASGSEKALLCCAFDQTGMRIVAGCQDSTIKMFKVNV